MNEPDECFVNLIFFYMLHYNHFLKFYILLLFTNKKFLLKNKFFKLFQFKFQIKLPHSNKILFDFMSSLYATVFLIRKCTGDKKEDAINITKRYPHSMIKSRATSNKEIHLRKLCPHFCGWRQ